MAQSEGIVGIDVSKARLDAYALPQRVERQVSNDPAGCGELARWLKSLGVRMVVLEASGGYERVAVKALRRAQVIVRVVDPKRVRHYAKAIGRLAKTDRIDAEVIAEFGMILMRQGKHKEIVVDDAARELLATLVGARQDLVDHKSGLEQQATAAQGPARRALAAVLTAITRQIDRLDRLIGAAIAKQQPFAVLAKRLDTVPGVGPVSIAAIIAWLPELGQLSRQQIAALVGVAPFDDTSGERVGQRYIQGGREKLRKTLFMAAMGGATQHNPVLAAYYRHLCAGGKEHKVAVIACLRKLLTILNAMLARQQDWHPILAAAPAPAVS